MELRTKIKQLSLYVCHLKQLIKLYLLSVAIITNLLSVSETCEFPEDFWETSCCNCCEEPVSSCISALISCNCYLFQISSFQTSLSQFPILRVTTANGLKLWKSSYSFLILKVCLGAKLAPYKKVFRSPLKVLNKQRKAVLVIRRGKCPSPITI